MKRITIGSTYFLITVIALITLYVGSFTASALATDNRYTTVNTPNKTRDSNNNNKLNRTQNNSNNSKSEDYKGNIIQFAFIIIIANIIVMGIILISLYFYFDNQDRKRTSNKTSSLRTNPGEVISSTLTIEDIQKYFDQKIKNLPLSDKLEEIIKTQNKIEKLHEQQINLLNQNYSSLEQLLKKVQRDITNLNPSYQNPPLEEIQKLLSPSSIAKLSSEIVELQEHIKRLQGKLDLGLPRENVNVPELEEKNEISTLISQSRNDLYTDRPTQLQIVDSSPEIADLSSLEIAYLVNKYNNDPNILYDYFPTEVSEDTYDYEQRRQNSSLPLTLKPQIQNLFLVIEFHYNYLLFPKDNSLTSGSQYNTICGSGTPISPFKRIKHSSSQQNYNFKLTKPAIVSPRGTTDEEWILEKQGELEFY